MAEFSITFRLTDGQMHSNFKFDNVNQSITQEDIDAAEEHFMLGLRLLYRKEYRPMTAEEGKR